MSRGNLRWVPPAEPTLHPWKPCPGRGVWLGPEQRPPLPAPLPPPPAPLPPPLPPSPSAPPLPSPPRAPAQGRCHLLPRGTAAGGSIVTGLAAGWLRGHRSPAGRTARVGGCPFPELPVPYLRCSAVSPRQQLVIRVINLWSRPNLNYLFFSLFPLATRPVFFHLESINTRQRSWDHRESAGISHP